MNTKYELTESERLLLLENLYTIKAEVDMCEDFSQGCVDALSEVIETLGGRYESIS